MFYELLATLVAGFAAGGLVYLASRMTRGFIPRSLVLATAALAMLGVSIWNEYNWFPRSQAQLPEGVAVVAVSESRAWYRPWTYATPFVNRFAALDTGSLRRNAEVPQQRIADLYLMERWRSAHGVQIAVDCTRGAQARLADVTYDDTGAMQSGRWEVLSPEAPLIRAACAEGAG